MIKFSKDKCAFDCFRAWQELLEDSVTIRNEQFIVSDFDTSLSKALDALLKTKEFRHKGAIQQAANFGFVIGFISSNLGSKWHLEYVLPQTKKFQITQSLKATLELLRFDKLFLIKQEQLFLELLKTKSSNLDSSISIPNGLELLESHFEELVQDVVSSIENKNVPTEVISKHLKNELLDKLILGKILTAND